MENQVPYYDGRQTEKLTKHDVNQSISKPEHVNSLVKFPVFPQNLKF